MPFCSNSVQGTPLSGASLENNHRGAHCVFPLHTPCPQTFTLPTPPAFVFMKETESLRNFFSEFTLTSLFNIMKCNYLTFQDFPYFFS